VIVDWKCLVNVVAILETQRLHHSLKRWSWWECCTNSNPRDGGWDP
jgi:hypothetical protein